MHYRSTLLLAVIISTNVMAQQSGYLGLTGNTVYIKSDASTSAKTLGLVLQSLSPQEKEMYSLM
jgi:uncharacterized membrane protein